MYLQKISLIILVSLISSVSLAQEEEVRPLTYVSLFEQVRDGVQLQAYRGIAKGPAGTEQTLSGNSLDQAILLHSKLRALGLKPVLTSGLLRGALLDKYVAESQGIEVAELDLKLTPERKAELRSILADHYWVQLPNQDSFISLDPSSRDNVLGRSPASFRKQLKRVPSNLFQRLEISIWMDFSFSGDRAKTRLLRFRDSFAKLYDKHLLLLFGDMDVNGNFVRSSRNRFVPILILDEEKTPAKVMSSEASRVAVASGGPVPRLDVHKIWMEIIISSPETRNISVRRDLFDENRPSESRLDEISILRAGNIDPSSMGGSLALINSELIEDLNDFEVPSHLQVLSEKEKKEIAQLLSGTEILLRKVADQLSYGMLTSAKAAATSHGYQVMMTPYLMSTSANPQDATLTTDIIEYSPEIIGSKQLSQMAASFTSGVMATKIEAELMKTVAPSAEILSVVELTERLQEAGCSWKAFDSSTASTISRFVDSPALLNSLLDYAYHGNILIFPVYDGRIAAIDDKLVWWRVNRNSGLAIGMLSPGIGGSIAKLQDESIREKVAVTHPPLLAERWGKRLVRMLRNLNQYRGSADTMPLETEREINMVYRIIRSAVGVLPAVADDNNPYPLFGLEGELAVKSVLSGWGTAPLAEEPFEGSIQ